MKGGLSNSIRDMPQRSRLLASASQGRHQQQFRLSRFAYVKNSITPAPEATKATTQNTGGVAAHHVGATAPTPTRQIKTKPPASASISVSASEQKLRSINRRSSSSASGVIDHVECFDDERSSSRTGKIDSGRSAGDDEPVTVKHRLWPPSPGVVNVWEAVGDSESQRRYQAFGVDQRGGFISEPCPPRGVEVRRLAATRCSETEIMKGTVFSSVQLCYRYYCFLPFIY